MRIGQGDKAVSFQIRMQPRLVAETLDPDDDDGQAVAFPHMLRPRPAGRPAAALPEAR